MPPGSPARWCSGCSRSSRRKAPRCAASTARSSRWTPTLAASAAMLRADNASNRLTGIALVSLTYLVFTLLDGSAKWLVATVPVIVVVWLRFLTHAVLACALLLPLKGRSLVKTEHWRWHLLRGAMFCAMTG